MAEGKLILFDRLSYKKHIKQFVKKYKENIQTLRGYDYYLKRLDKDEIPQRFFEVSIFDVVDNTGLSKVIRKIHALKINQTLEVSTYYKKPDFLHRYNYINRTLFGKSTGIVGEIKFKNDVWLSSLNISYTHLSNSEIILEYKFRFKRIISSYRQIHQFVIDNIDISNKSSVFTSYVDEHFFEHARLIEYVELENRFFEDILQTYITNWFFSKYGTEYCLPIEYSCLTKNYNKKLRNKLRHSFGNQCYEKEGTHILFSDWHDRTTVSIYSHGKTFPNISIKNFLMECSVEMYYKLFNRIEAQELERHMRKYLNSRKHFIASRDIKWFICKLRALDEEKENIEKTLSEQEKPYHSNIYGWTLYSKYSENNVKDILTYPYYIDRFRSLYNRNLDYLNSIAAVQNNSVVIWITAITLLATIAGILIA